MEHNKEDSEIEIKPKGQRNPPKWEEWVSCLPASKNSWRRVFNEDLNCYELYVRGSRVLIATGIKNEADSYISGMIPALVDLVEQILTEIKNGEVDENTYRGLRYILNEHSRTVRKRQQVD